MPYHPQCSGCPFIVETTPKQHLYLLEIYRLITVLRGGSKPRRSVRILLSQKNTRSFEQTVAGIGDILCPGEPVKRLFGYVKLCYVPTIKILRKLQTILADSRFSNCLWTTVDILKIMLFLFFRLSGRLVMCLADFYLEDNVFFAYCQDKMNPEDLSLDNTGKQE